MGFSRQEYWSGVPLPSPRKDSRQPFLRPPPIWELPSWTKKDDLFIPSFHFVFNLLAVPHGMWDLIPRPGIEPVLPVLAVWPLNHWTTRDVPHLFLSSFDVNELLLLLNRLWEPPPRL